jgi:hypothetical protein
MFLGHMEPRGKTFFDGYVPSSRVAMKPDTAPWMSSQGDSYEVVNGWLLHFRIDANVHLRTLLLAATAPAIACLSHIA